jgi:integrase
MIEGRLKYVRRVVDRYAVVRYYFRVNGRYTRLPDLPNSAEFLRAYHALLASHYAAKSVARPRKRTRGKPLPYYRDELIPGSLGWVAANYLRSPRYRELAASTRALYEAALHRMRTKIGSRILVRLDTHDVDLYCAQIAREYGDATADLHLRLISTLWKFSKGFPECKRRGRYNPTFEAEKHYAVRRPHEPWPTVVQQKFLDAAGPSLTLAFYLLLYTGQRRADVVSLRWSDYDGSKIHLKQSKTGQQLALHVHRRLRDVLETTPRVHEQILTNKWDRPFAKDSLTVAVKQVLRNIGASKYTLHGLRKTAGVALAELGRSELEIMAVLGHKTPKMAAHYCREANKSRLSENAIKAWERASDLKSLLRRPSPSND